MSHQIHFVVMNTKKETNMKAYLSHAIRGKLSNKCSAQQLKENCERAIEIANQIREACPWLDLYVPAEHEDFVKKAYDKKYITEKQILDIDCEILLERDNIIIFIPEGDKLQGGRLVEHDFAIDQCMPLGTFSQVNGAVEFLTERYEYDLSFGGGE